MAPSDDIQVFDDAVSLIRRRPAMYLRVISATALAEALAHDALVLGATRVVIERCGEWTIVGADVDWLRVRGRYAHFFEPAELFHRIVAFPEDGANSMRHEVLTTAFASEVVTATPGTRLSVAGNTSEDDAVWSSPRRIGLERIVGFKGVVDPTEGGG